MTQSELEKQLFNAVSKNKPVLAKKLLDAGVVLQETWSLDSLVQKSKSLSFMKYLESKGVDLNQRNYILLFKACMAFKTENVAYLLAKLPPQDEDRMLPLCFRNLIGKANGNYEEMASTANLLYPRMNSEQIANIIEEVNNGKFYVSSTLVKMKKKH